MCFRNVGRVSNSELCTHEMNEVIKKVGSFANEFNVCEREKMSFGN